MKKFAVIVAGGTGERMGTSIPKQFLLLKNKTLLQRATEAFISSFPDIEIIIVLPKAHAGMGLEIAGNLQATNKIHFAEGGITRFHSVKNGLELVQEPSIIFVHDAVRSLVSTDLIHRCYNQAADKGSAIPSVPCTDSVRLLKDDVHTPLNRDNVQIIQTPQTFQSHILKTAFQQSYQIFFTDEATVAEAAGFKVFLIKGDFNNLKITRPIDLLIAEKLLEEIIF